MPHQRAHFLIAKRRAVFVELLSRHSLGALGREMLFFFPDTDSETALRRFLLDRPVFFSSKTCQSRISVLIERFGWPPILIS